MLELWNTNGRQEGILPEAIIKHLYLFEVKLIVLYPLGINMRLSLFKHAIMKYISDTGTILCADSVHYDVHKTQTHTHIYTRRHNAQMIKENF